jgi:hypothetical protein
VLQQAQVSIVFCHDSGIQAEGVEGEAGGQAEGIQAEG